MPHVSQISELVSCTLGMLLLLRQRFCFPPERPRGTPSFGTHFFCEQDCEGCHPGVEVGWGPHNKCYILGA